MRVPPISSIVCYLVSSCVVWPGRDKRLRRTPARTPGRRARMQPQARRAATSAHQTRTPRTRRSSALPRSRPARPESSVRPGARSHPRRVRRALVRGAHGRLASYARPRRHFHGQQSHNSQASTRGGSLAGHSSGKSPKNRLLKTVFQKPCVLCLLRTVSSKNR